MWTGWTDARRGRFGTRYDAAVLTFPVELTIGPFRLPAHVVLEVSAYLVGFRLFLWDRRRLGDSVPGPIRWTVAAAAIAGAALGARFLYWLEDPAATLAHVTDLAYLLGGKTVVGGLLGGTLAVEITKAVIHERRRTGDLFAIPLAVGIAIGRIGCFLGGLPDRTYGSPSSLPWAVDFGDGIARHPTQLYEAATIALVALLLVAWRRRRPAEGDLFCGLMVAYLALRLGVDFIKPAPVHLLSLSTIQWAALAGLLYYGRDIRCWLGRLA